MFSLSRIFHLMSIRTPSRDHSALQVCEDGAGTQVCGIGRCLVDTAWYVDRIMYE